MSRQNTSRQSNNDLPVYLFKNDGELLNEHNDHDVKLYIKSIAKTHVNSNSGEIVGAGAGAGAGAGVEDMIAMLAGEGYDRNYLRYAEENEGEDEENEENDFGKKKRKVTKKYRK